HRYAARAKRRYLAEGGILDNSADEIGTHYALAEAHAEAIEFFIESARESTLVNELVDAVGWLERARTAAEGIDNSHALRLAILLDLCHFRSILGGFVDLEAVKVLGERIANELGSTAAQAELHYLSG